MDQGMASIPPEPSDPTFPPAQPLHPICYSCSNLLHRRHGAGHPDEGDSVVLWCHPTARSGMYVYRQDSARYVPYPASFCFVPLPSFPRPGHHSPVLPYVILTQSGDV